MKLTLRTLLAYIDNLLPAADAEAFENLLNESEAASNLCKRIRSVMTRPELGAPEVLDKGLHLDPNVTAEYLDNVLSAEESPDYERLCISSDRQLSEVSACHQILTVVQIEPAAVEQAWRDKIYKAPELVNDSDAIDLDGDFNASSSPSQSGFMASLSGLISGASGILGGGQGGLKLNLDRKNREESSAPEQKSVPVPPPVENKPSVEPPPVRKETVPEEPQPTAPPTEMVNQQSALEQYAQMMAPELQPAQTLQNKTLPWVAFLVAMSAVIIVFVFLFLSPKDKTRVASTQTPDSATQNESSEQGAEAKVTPVADEAATSPQTPAESPAAIEQTPADDSAKENADSADNAPDNNVNTVPADNADQKTNPDAAAEDNGALTTLPEGTQDEASELKPIEDADVLQPLEDDQTAPADAESADPSENGSPLIEPLDETAADTPTPGAAETAEETADTPADSGSSIELSTEDGDAAVSNVELGKFIKRTNVAPQILVYKEHDQSGSWNRMKESAPINAGDSLLAFPDYRPDILFGTDLRIRLVGPAKIQISPKSTPSEIHIILEHGKMLLATSKSFDKKVVVTCSTLPTSLVVTQPSVKAAFDTNVFKPEADPKEQSAQFYGTISLLMGQAEIAYQGKTSSISAKTLIDCQSGTLNPQGTEASWINSENLPAEDFEKRLASNKRIGISLTELLDSKSLSQEFRIDALISLALIGRYTALIEDFNKEDKFAYWMDEFIVLQNSILLSKENAQQALTDLTNRYGSDGEFIYEILWKYQNDLTDADMKSLISYLRDNDLSVRVAAFCLLKSRGVNIGTYKPTDLKKSESSLRSLEHKYNVIAE